MDFLISDTMRLRKSLYFSQKFLLVVFLKFLKFLFRFLIKFLMWQVIQGCSFGLTVICLLGIACSAMSVSVSVISFAF